MKSLFSSASGFRQLNFWQQPSALLWGLGITALVASSLGIGFGLALRLNRPQQPGSTLWHSDQSFPPKDGSIPSPSSETVEPEKSRI